MGDAAVADDAFLERARFAGGFASFDGRDGAGAVADCCCGSPIFGANGYDASNWARDAAWDCCGAGMVG